MLGAVLSITACAAEDSGVEVVRAERSEPADVDIPDSSPSADTDPPSEPPPGADDRPCTLLTPDEISAALGRPMSEGTEGTLFDRPSCSWVVTDAPPDRSDDLSVFLVGGPLDDDRRAEIDALSAAATTVFVDGVGDLAVIENERIPGPIYVVTGDRYLFVDLSNFFLPGDFDDDAALIDIYTDLATLATGRADVPTTDSPTTEMPTTETPNGGTVVDEICSVLTLDEIAAALGREVGPGVFDSFDGEVSRCTWTVTEPPSPELSDDLNLRVLVLPLLDVERAELDALVADPDSIVVEGLGDLAVIENSILPGPMYVVLGDRYVEIDLGNYSTPTDFTEDRIIELLPELGQLVIPRL